MILFDLGLSSGSEKLLPNPAVRAILGERFLSTYLTFEARRIPPQDRLEDFKMTQPAVWDYIEQIEGLRALLEVRLAHPDILCGIVSHYVGDDIREVLNAFVMHGWPVDPSGYDSEDQPKPLVIHKGELIGINRILKPTWHAWQAVRNEIYVKDIVQNCLIEAADGSAKGLAELVDLIRDNEGLKPDDSQSPIFICDFLGLLGLRHARFTLERLFKRVFPSLTVVKTKDFAAMERTGQYLFLDTEGGAALKEAIGSILSAHDVQSPEQLVCVVSGRANDEVEVSKVFQDLRVGSNFWYIIPSLSVVVSNKKYDTFTFDRFIKAIVTSACEYAFYDRHAEVKGGERLLADLHAWLKTLLPKVVPLSLTTLWDCLCEVFEQRILTNQGVKDLLTTKTKDEAAQREQRGRRRGLV